MANKEEMEILKQKLAESSQMMAVNNEMVLERTWSTSCRTTRRATGGNAINYQRVDGKFEKKG
jgi:hypothetical protein